MNQHVRITTGARLHFGLLDVSSPFGGCGVMVDHPETIVDASPSEKFQFIAPDSEKKDHSTRVRSIAERLSDRGQLPAVELQLIEAAPTHTGLGSGTQLSLAIAEAILRVVSTDAEGTLRDRCLMAADRGKRSAVGTHGYFSGGFIAEGISTNEDDGLNQAEFRLELPSSWRAVVLLPSQLIGTGTTVAGSDEQSKFDRLATSDSQRDNLSTILVDELIPAIRATSFTLFADAVQRYNLASGMLFSPVQGGPYNGAETTELIDDLRSAGHQGIGQSSWGPGVFVWFEDEPMAVRFCKSWTDSRRHPLLCRPKSDGRDLELR